MSYEILNKDIFSDDEPGKDSKKKDKIKYTKSDNDNLDLDKDDKKKFKFEFKQFYLNLFIILVIVILIILFFTTNMSSYFNTKNNDNSKTLVLVGDLSEFNKTINGNLSIYSSEFELKYPNSVLNDQSKDIFIENYSGQVYLENKSIIFDGMANKIGFGKNNLNLNYNKFKLTSKVKTTLNFKIPIMNLKFENGRIIFDEVLNYEFLNSSILLNNFNTSMTYDGTFSFSGTTDEFTLNSSKDNLVVNYKK